MRVKSASGFLDKWWCDSADSLYDFAFTSAKNEETEATARGKSHSVSFLDKTPAVESRLVVVRSLVRAFRQFDFLFRNLLVWNQLEKVGDAVQAGSLLVVGADDVPGREIRIRSLQHR